MESETGTAVTAYGENAKVTINSGNFKGATAAVVSLYRAEVVISGGTFEGPNWTERTGKELFVVKYTHGPYHGGMHGGAGGGGEFVLWRTHYTITGTRTYPVYGGTFFSEMNGAFIISDNPTVKAPAGGALVTALCGIALSSSEQRITIRGGTFEGDQIIHGVIDPFLLQIYGGTFTTNPSEYCGKDHVVFGTADGKYTVKSQAKAEAKIKSGSQEAYYTSLSEALSAVKDGETVTLLKDYSQPVTLSKNSSYTLDLGGKTVSNSITASAGTVTIQNGTVNYTGAGTAVAASGFAHLAVNCTVNADSGTALSASGGTLTVTSGTYRGKLSASGGTLSLVGGKYSADPSGYLPEGSYAKKDFYGLYSIKKVETDPFKEIKNKEQLLSFAKAVNDGQRNLNAILMNDIDLAGINWEPIGTDVHMPYAGTFDGNGYEIQHLNVNQRTSDNSDLYVGLFRSVSGTVQNLKIASGSISGEGSTQSVYAGSIAAVLKDGGKIINCSNAASVTAYSHTMEAKAGGMAGADDRCAGSVELCSNTGTITAKATPVRLGFRIHAGGIAGGKDIYVKNCYNTGTVIADTNNSGLKGVDGFSTANGFVVDRSVEYCYNIGNIFDIDLISKGDTQVSGAPFSSKYYINTNSYHLV